MNFFKILTASVASLAIAAMPFTSFVSYAEDTTAEETTTSSSSDDDDVETFTSEDGDFEYAMNTTDDDYYVEDLYVENSIRITDYFGDDEDLVIPSEIDGYTVTTLADDSLADAEEAVTITIPATVNYIGDSVFFDTQNCTEFIVEDGNEAYETRDGVLLSCDGGAIYAYPSAKEGTTYLIPDTVEAIAGSCFALSTLESITLSNNLETIYNWAFAYSSITSIEIPATVTEIDEFAFAYCESLEEVTFASDSELETIGSAAFGMCSLITEVELPESLSEIGQSAFLGTGLTSITIPSSVTEIGYCAFGYDENFEAIDDFIIYGYTGSEASVYATDEDSDNDYENDFEFVSLGESETETETTTENTTVLGLSGTKALVAVIGISAVLIAGIIAASVVLVKKLMKK